MKEYVLKLSEEKFKELKFALNIAIDNRNTMIEAFNGEDRLPTLIPILPKAAVILSVYCPILSFQLPALFLVSFNFSDIPFN